MLLTVGEIMQIVYTIFCYIGKDQRQKDEWKKFIQAATVEE